MVWFERRSRYSRYGRLHLDLLTTPNMLTTAGQVALKALGNAELSAHASRWEKVPLASLDSLGRAVLRATLKPENRKPNQGPSVTVEFPAARQFQLEPRRAASA
jgi:hypothetical protein